MICQHCREAIDFVWALASHGRAYCSESCFYTRKGDDPVLLYFHNDCSRLRLSALEYFEIAYMRRFNKAHPNPGADYQAYLLRSELPPYVVAFVKEKMECNNTSQLPLFGATSSGSV